MPVTTFLFAISRFYSRVVLRRLNYVASHQYRNVERNLKKITYTLLIMKGPMILQSVRMTELLNQKRNLSIGAGKRLSRRKLSKRKIFRKINYGSIPKSQHKIRPLQLPQIQYSLKRKDLKKKLRPFQWR